MLLPKFIIRGTIDAEKDQDRCKIVIHMGDILRIQRLIASPQFKFIQEMEKAAELT